MDRRGEPERSHFYKKKCDQVGIDLQICLSATDQTRSKQYGASRSPRRVGNELR